MDHRTLIISHELGRSWPSRKPDRRRRILGERQRERILAVVPDATFSEVRRAIRRCLWQERALEREADIRGRVETDMPYIPSVNEQDAIRSRRLR